MIKMRQRHTVRFAVLFSILGFFLLYACQYRVALNPPWKKDNTDGKATLKFHTDSLVSRLESARLAGQPVFMDFYTSWCGPCRVMDRDVFTDGKLAADFNRDFVSLKINAEAGEGVALARRFQIKAYPTLVFLDMKGEEKERSVGLTTAAELRRLGRKVAR